MRDLPRKVQLASRHACARRGSHPCHASRLTPVAARAKSRARQSQRARHASAREGRNATRGAVDCCSGAGFRSRHADVHGLAVHFHRLLTDVHEGAHLVDPGFPDEVAGVGSRDVVVACLFRRYSRLTVELLGTVHEGGAHVVLVTDGRGHDFAAHADHVLVAVATGPALYDSMVAPLWLLESLVAEAAAVYPDRSRARLEKIERFTEDQRLLLS